MIIEGNKKELEAMEQFHKGNRQEGLRLQEEFAAAFREEYKDKDHCPCKKASELTEHTIVNEIEAPHEILRKEYQ